MVNKNIFEEDDEWYFWDEAGLDTVGPFKTLELAEQAYHSYGRYLDKEPIRKMKRNMGV